MIILILLTVSISFSASAGPGGRGHGNRQRERVSEKTKTEEASSLYFAEQPSALAWVTEETGYEAPEVRVSARQIAEKAISGDITFRWYVNGERIGEEETVEMDGEGCAGTSRNFPELQNASAGVYAIRCEASVSLSDGTTKSLSSWTVNFIVAKGILESSLITFSDLHETWDNLGQALQDVLDSTGGYLPETVVATGDFANGRYEGEQESAFSGQYLDRIRLQLAGLNTFWVAGHHDNAAACRTAVGEDYTACGNLTILSYDYLTAASGRDGREELRRALEKTAENYQGEVVLVAAHSGLHVLGVDPASAAQGVIAWSGGEGYNISGANETVKMLNEFAEAYGMKIVYFFGHNHTRGEKEFRKLPGGSILSPADANRKTAERMSLKFIYAHAGYLTDSRNGEERYTFMTWNAEGDISIELRSLK